MPLVFWTSIISATDATVDRNNDDDDCASRMSGLQEAKWVMRDKEARR